MWGRTRPLWSSLSELSAHTLTAHMCAGTKSFARTQSLLAFATEERWHWVNLLGALCWHWSLWAFVTAVGAVLTQPWLHSLPPPLGYLKFPPLSPVPASPLQWDQASLKDQRKHAGGFLLLLGGRIEGNITVLTNFLKLQNRAGGRKTLRIQFKLVK